MKKSGFIEKAAVGDGEFYCTTKQCNRILIKLFEFESQITWQDQMKGIKSGYDIPTTRRELQEIFKKNSTKNVDGTYNNVQAVTQRCLVCTYRAYRNLHMKKFGYYPDDNIPDDFNVNSDIPPYVDSSVPLKTKTKKTSFSDSFTPGPQSAGKDYLTKLLNRMSDFHERIKYDKRILIKFSDYFRNDYKGKNIIDFQIYSSISKLTFILPEIMPKTLTNDKLEQYFGTLKNNYFFPYNTNINALGIHKNRFIFTKNNNEFFVLPSDNEMSDFMFNIDEISLMDGYHNWMRDVVKYLEYKRFVSMGLTLFVISDSNYDKHIKNRLRNASSGSTYTEHIKFNIGYFKDEQFHTLNGDIFEWDDGKKTVAGIKFSKVIGRFNNFEVRELKGHLCNTYLRNKLEGKN
tara:strand:+ start:3797 stop:5005 length:1209 start_codon:yes stop_codon:yes gene_type:complete